jgi:hypothetical protein
MKTNLFIVGMVSVIMTTIVSCDTAPPEPPLTPIVEDCSFNTTVTAIDSLDGFPPPCQNGTGGIYTTWHEGYEITDISFNPNNPNELVVAMEIHREGVIPQINSTSGGHAIVHVNLCSGDETVIFTSEIGGRVWCLDWGTNDKILFIHGSNPHAVFHMNPDGSNLTSTAVPINYQQARNISWLSNEDGFALMFTTSNIYYFDPLGEPIQDTLVGLLAFDFDHLPDGRIAYISDHIGIFNPANGTSEILFDATLLGSQLDIAYSAKHNGLLWAVDTMVGLTNIETGQTAFLKQIPSKVGWYWYTGCSSNGYLAYVARVRSPSLSDPCARMVRNELRFINADGTEERRLVLDFQ